MTPAERSYIRRLIVVWIAAFVFLVFARLANGAEVCVPPGNRKAPCVPPATYVAKAAGPPYDAPTKYGGAVVRFGRTHWQWIRVGQPSRPCTAAERADRLSGYAHGCAVQVGEVLYLTPAFRSSLSIAALSTPIAIPFTPPHGTEILVPVDFRHGPQRMNVTVYAEELPWGNPTFQSSIGVRDGAIPLRVWRDRKGSRTLIQAIQLPACFPCSVSFAVSDAYQFGDTLAVEWRPGVCPTCTTASIIQNQSGDPVTRDAYVRDGERTRRP